MVDKPKDNETISVSNKNFGKELAEIQMGLKKTINNYQKVPPVDTKYEPVICVNGVKWNQCPLFSNQFVTVDDLSRLSVYKNDSDKPIVQEVVAKGRLSCVAVEPRGGQ